MGKDINDPNTVRIISVVKAREMNDAFEPMVLLSNDHPKLRADIQKYK